MIDTTLDQDRWMVSKYILMNDEQTKNIITRINESWYLAIMYTKKWMS